MRPSKDTVHLPLTNEVKKCDLDGRLLTQHCTHGQVTQQWGATQAAIHIHAMNKIENKHMNVKTSISCYIQMNVICFAKIDQVAQNKLKNRQRFYCSNHVPLKEVSEHPHFKQGALKSLGS